MAQARLDRLGYSRVSNLGYPCQEECPVMLVTLLFSALLTVTNVVSVAPFDTYGGGPLALPAHAAGSGVVVVAPYDTYGGGPLH